MMSRLLIILLPLLLGATSKTITLNDPYNIDKYGMSLSWSRYNGGDFDAYLLYRSLDNNVTTNDTLIRVITDQNTLSTRDSLLHAGTLYYYRLFVRDTSGSICEMSNTVHARTDENTYPFSDEIDTNSLRDYMEASDCSWGLSSVEYHSPPFSLTDSPNGPYNSGDDNSLYLVLNLNGANMPVLNYWEKYILGTGDFCEVSISQDFGEFWSILYNRRGSVSDWQRVRIDLTEWTGRIVILRFRLKADGNNNGDGWWIDDISIEDSYISVVPYPFFDDVEDSTIRSYWLTSTWIPVSEGLNGSFAWKSNTAPSTRSGALTLGNYIDLTNARRPQFGAYVSNHSVNLEVSNNGGLSWQFVGSLSPDPNYDFKFNQIDLSAFAGSHLRIRFAPFVSTELSLVDNIMVREAPQDVVLEPAIDITSHSARLTWHKYSGGDFRAYELRRSEDPGVNWNSELVARITDQNDTTFVDNFLRSNTTYYYRVFIVDTLNFRSLGSNEIDFTTHWITEYASYPFTDDLESMIGGYWAYDGPWGLTQGFAHSGIHAWNESPEGNYGNGWYERTLYLGIDLSNADMPVLSFWEFADVRSGDFCYVRVSDGLYTETVYKFTNYTHGWHKVQIDLSKYAGSSNVIIKFVFSSNQGSSGNGWFIDDIEIKETEVPQITYPFFDDVETDYTRDKWIASIWKPKFTMGVDSSIAWLNPTDRGYLTLGNEIDLTNASHPVLKVCKIYQGNWQISTDRGHTWQNLQQHNLGSYHNMYLFYSDLSPYVGARIRLRFKPVVGNFRIDNIYIGEDYSYYQVPDSVKLLGPDNIIAVTGTNTPEIYAIVYEPGVTDSAGQGNGVMAQLGFGPRGSFPWEGGWSWTDASYAGDYNSIYDKYRGTLFVTNPGEYDFAFRFSIDNGNTWVYADLNGNDLGAGGGDGYSLSRAGHMTVTLIPDISVTQDSVGFEIYQGSTSSSELEIQNTGEGNLYFQVSESQDGTTAEDVPWLFVTPPEGVVSPGNSMSLTIGVTTDSLHADTTYTAFVLIESNDPDESLYRITVSLHVLSSSANVVSGSLIKPNGSLIGQTGTIQVFRNSTMVGEYRTDALGRFVISGLTPNDTFDLRCFTNGYYPTLIHGVVNPTSNLTIKLYPVPEPVPTHLKVDFYGDTVRVDGENIREGDVITVFDPDGVLCGVYFVNTPGQYGFLHVYGDDPTTDIDEGASPNDTLVFLVNGNHVYNIRPNMPVWTANNDIIKLNFDASSTAGDTIVLRNGWNLISFNVMPEDTGITSVLSSIMENLVVVSSFDMSWNGARTYDPGLPAFSDLTAMDPYHGYWIKVNSQDTLIVNGVKIHSSEIIPLDAGWNLVSYLPEVTESVEIALSSIAGNIAVVNAFDSVAMTYQPGSPYNDLFVMRNGLGYWIKTYTEDTLIYSEGVVRGSKGETGIIVHKPENLDGVIPTPYWTDYYGFACLNDTPVEVGDTITAYDPDGVLCGMFVVRNQGYYGFMHVYGDDPTTTTIDEGASPGDSIRFYINGQYIATASGDYAWTGTRDLIEFNLGTLHIGEEGHSPATEFKFLPIMPNPAGRNFVLKFNLPVRSKVNVEVYDISGRVVKSIEWGQLEPGMHEIRMDTDGLSMGIYFVRVRAGEFEGVRKLVIAR